MDAAVVVLIALALTDKAGAPLVQYELRCPHCGTEQPWNLYSQGDLPPSLECPACEDAYETAPMRAVSFFAQLPAAPTE